MDRLKQAALKRDPGIPKLAERWMELSLGNRGLSMMDAPRRAEGDLRRPYTAMQIR